MSGGEGQVRNGAEGLTVKVRPGLFMPEEFPLAGVVLADLLSSYFGGTRLSAKLFP
jgi:hypothetical protein